MGKSDPVHSVSRNAVAESLLPYQSPLFFKGDAVGSGQISNRIRIQIEFDTQFPADIAGELLVLKAFFPSQAMVDMQGRKREGRKFTALSQFEESPEQKCRISAS